MSETTKIASAINEFAQGWRLPLIDALIALGIALAALCVYLAPVMQGRPLTNAPEAHVAAVAREMLQNHDFVLPTLGGEACVNMPPMPYWLAAISSTLFFGGASGDTHAMARAALLPPAFSAAAAVFLVILIGSRLFGRTSGITAGLILAASHLVARYAHTALGDSTLMLACAASVCGMALLLSEKPGLGGALLAGFGLGAGILTKGHVPLILIAIPLAIEFFILRRTIGWFQILYVALAFAIALLVATPWLVLVSRRSANAIDSMLSEAGDAIYKVPAEEVIPDEFPASPAPNTLRGLSYYACKGALGLLPWTPLLLVGFIVSLLPLKSAARIPKEERDATRFFALYAGIGFLIFHLAQQKREYYLLSLLPAVALAAGAMIGRFNSPGGIREERMGWMQLAIGAAGALAIGSASIWGKTSAGTAHIAELAETVGGFATPLALLFFGANYLCARFWANGQGVFAVAVFAALAFALLAFDAFRPAARDRRAANVYGVRSGDIARNFSDGHSLIELTGRADLQANLRDAIARRHAAER